MATGEQQALSSTGHFRVVTWFSTVAILFLLIFLYRLDTLRPNWLVLGGPTLFLCLVGLPGIRDMLNLKPGSNNERIVQIAAAVGALVTIITLVYFSWRHGAPSVMRVIVAYLLPASVPVSLAFAAVAFYVERKHKVRVFVGNRGWLYLPPPSNSALDRPRA